MTCSITLRAVQAAKAAVLVASILAVGTFVPSTSAKCVIKPTRNPDAAKACRVMSDYTPPDNGHPDGTRSRGTRQTRVKDQRDTQLKNRWFKDFNCPVG